MIPTTMFLEESGMCSKKDPRFAKARHGTLRISERSSAFSADRNPYGHHVFPFVNVLDGEKVLPQVVQG